MEGDTVTYTLDYLVSNGPLDNGVITDVLPTGVTYVSGSATDSGNGEFAFDGYDSATRTLTWTATQVTGPGSVSYKVTVNVGAAELPQPLKNTACIDSDDTDKICDNTNVFVPPPPKGETSVPTGPPSDVTGTTGTTQPGSGLLLAMLALVGIALAVVFVAPTPASIRKRLNR